MKDLQVYIMLYFIRKYIEHLVDMKHQMKDAFDNGVLTIGQYEEQTLYIEETLQRLDDALNS